MQTTHDPPGDTPAQKPPDTPTDAYPAWGLTLPTDRPLSVDEVRMPRAADPDPGAVAARIVERAETLRSSAYRLMAIELREHFGHPVDPLDLIWDMAMGGYRLKRHRNQHLVLSDGVPVGEYMSFRAISAELARLTGELVAYETLRRWWERVWETEPPDGVATAAERARVEQEAHASAHADAQRTAAAVQTNPDVPSAAFLPPTP